MNVIIRSFNPSNSKTCGGCFRKFSPGKIVKIRKRDSDVETADDVGNESLQYQIMIVDKLKENEIVE